MSEYPGQSIGEGQVQVHPPNRMQSGKSALRMVLDPGIKSPGTTLAGLLPAVYFIVGELIKIMNEKGPDAVEQADVKTIVMWLAVAAIGWMSRSHNVSSQSSGVDS